MKTTNIAIDIIGFILMAVLFVNGGMKKYHKSVDQRLFHKIILTVMLMFLIDGASWALDQTVFPGDVIIQNIVNVLLYLMGPITAIFWLAYVDYKINNNINGLKKRYIYYIIPTLINSVLCFIQLFTPILFKFDTNNFNQYIRLPLSWYSFALPLIYIIYATLILILNQKRILKRNFIPLIMYMIFPFLGVIIQMLGTNLSTIYIGTAISILIVYLRIQNDIDLIDYLTGLQNRRHLIKYLNEKLVRNHHDNLYVIMIDIDNFKTINDTYGHNAGDRALVYISDIFTKSVKINDFVARYAGDEFVIVVDLLENEKIEDLLDVINYNINLFNDCVEDNFKLEISYGYTKYQTNDTVEDLLKRSDIQMYLQKQTKHNINV